MYKFNEGCTKFCERHTKFFEGCTKGSKVCSEIGIGPQSLPYGFQNDIMYHPCSDGEPRSNRIGCTKFNKACTIFCEGCTKSSKLRSEVGINPQLLPYGFQNEIMCHRCSDGGPGNNMIGCTKFNEGCTKFVKDVPNFVKDALRVPKFVLRWEMTSNRLFYINVKGQPFKLSAYLHLSYRLTHTSNLFILKACL